MNILRGDCKTGVVALILAASIYSLSALSASYDCRKASTPVEKTICADEELSRLDSELSSSYKRTLATSNNTQEIKARQKEWLSVERNRCTDSICLKIAYERRIDELDSMYKHAIVANVTNDRNDYVQDPEPQIFVSGTPVDDYPTAEDPEVCDLYQQNLSFFAQRNEPLSCNQPLAPFLKEKIQPVQWEDLDPEKYSVLFKSMVRDLRGLDEPSGKSILTDEQIYALSQREVKERSWVFRRALLTLKGFPAYFVHRGHQAEHVPTETPFQLVQYGPNVLDPNNPDPAFRCKWEAERRVSPGKESSKMRIYVAHDDLDGFYGKLSDWIQPPTALWLVNGNPYGESFDDNGDVRLSQLKLKPSLGLEPICLYHFRKGSHKGEKQ